jgi:hypothetical protein
MKPQYRHADHTQGAIKQLWAELRSLTQSGPEQFFVCTRPGKSINVIGTSPIPPAAVLVGSRNQFTLFYSIQLPNGERASEHHIEVVHDQDGLMWFREGSKLLTPQQMANKLVTFVVES